MARALCADRQLDVRSATCSLAEYRRAPESDPAARGGLGAWARLRNGDTSFLSQGEERHWEFSYVEAYEEEGVAEDGSEVAAMKSDAYAVPQDAGEDEAKKGTDKGGKL